MTALNLIPIRIPVRPRWRVSMLHISGYGSYAKLAYHHKYLLYAHKNKYSNCICCRLSYVVVCCVYVLLPHPTPASPRHQMSNLLNQRTYVAKFICVCACVCMAPLRGWLPLAE